MSSHIVHIQDNNGKVFAEWLTPNEANHWLDKNIHLLGYLTYVLFVEDGKPYTINLDKIRINIANKEARRKKRERENMF